jgi:cell division protein FtsW (lipid II flippase)
MEPVLQMVENSGNTNFIPAIIICFLMLIIYLCRYLTKKITRERLPIENIMYIFGPILLVFVLVAKDNGSTALMILMVSVIVLVIGQFTGNILQDLFLHHL